jgi:antitoxin YefM
MTEARQHARRAVMVIVAYSAAREKLAHIWDQEEDSQEEVILRRRGQEDLVLIPARELRSLKETVHLLRSPRNAARLMAAVARSDKEGGEEFDGGGGTRDGGRARRVVRAPDSGGRSKRTPHRHSPPVRCFLRPPSA